MNLFVSSQLLVWILWILDYNILHCQLTKRSTSPLQLLNAASKSDESEEENKMLVPFKVWANPKKSALKPRKRDLYEPKLLLLLGDDFDHRWMRKSSDKHANQVEWEEDRKSVIGLRALAMATMNESSGWGRAGSSSEWLVKRATCPVRFSWNDIGPYFWPRSLKHAHCHPAHQPCSWPPGMTCAPAPPKILHILRWHCRLRRWMRRDKIEDESDDKEDVLKRVETWKENNSNSSDANISNLDKSTNKSKKKRKKRKKYRCMWIKVPYPVPEDCICTCKT